MEAYKVNGRTGKGGQAAKDNPKKRGNARDREKKSKTRKTRKDTRNKKKKKKGMNKELQNLKNPGSQELLRK